MVVEWIESLGLDNPEDEKIMISIIIILMRFWWWWPALRSEIDGVFIWWFHFKEKEEKKRPMAVELSPLSSTHAKGNGSRESLFTWIRMERSHYILMALILPVKSLAQVYMRYSGQGEVTFRWRWWCDKLVWWRGTDYLQSSRPHISCTS